MMAQDREKYRKLPGRRRGFLMGSSVWMGSDHLLLVKSARFREEYKRFYLRDIQSIVVAETARFHLSTRSAFIGLIWSTLFIIAVTADVFTRFHLAWVVGFLGVVLIAAWIYISAASSCRCRLLTAVSSEDLPSVYRSWTARKFLEQVEPYIAQVQGVIEGNWAEAVDQRQVGPIPEGRVGIAYPAAAGPLAAASMPAPDSRRSRTLISLSFVVALCLGGLADLLSMRVAEQAARWVLLGFMLLQIVLGVAVLVQNYKGVLRPALRNLAIVTLAAFGVWYYAVQMAAGVAIGLESATRQMANRGPDVQRQYQALSMISYPWARGAAGVISLILGLIGIALIMRSEPEQRQEPISFNPPVTS
jgi:hypothetical protein